MRNPTIPTDLNEESQKERNYEVTLEDTEGNTWQFKFSSEIDEFTEEDILNLYYLYEETRMGQLPQKSIDTNIH